MTAYIYSGAETQFQTNGLGTLEEASIKITEKLNGPYTLDATAAATGKHFEDIKPGNYILCTVDPSGKYQPFRIETVIKKSDQKVEIRGNHIGYELNGIPVKPFNAQGITNALQGLKDNSMIENPFLFQTDIQNDESTYYQVIPQACRACLGGTEGSILDVFGGEYEWDGYTVNLLKRRGADKGVTIRYGKNLIDLKQEQAIENTFTGVVSFWSKDDAVSTGEIQYVPNHEDYQKQRIRVYDATDDFDTQPSLSQLNARSQKYITDNKIGEPKVNLTLSYIDLSQTENYKGKIPAQAISLGDTVAVYFERLGVATTARVIETKWDSNKNRYDSITIGSVKASLAQTIYDATAEMESVVKNANRITSIVQRIDREMGSIRSTVSQVTEDVDGIKVEVSQLDQTAQNISQTVTEIQGDYVKQSAYNQDAENIQIQFTAMQEDVDKNTSNLDELQTVITMNADGVTVGKNTSDIRGVFGNESLDFIDTSGTKLAWLSTKDGLGATEVSIGDATTKNKRWRLIVSSDGSHFRITRHS